MKVTSKLFICVVLLLSAAAVSSAQEMRCRGGLVKQEVDRASGVTSFSVPVIPRYQQLSPSIGADFGPSGVLVQFLLIGGFDAWKYRKCHETTLSADGKRLVPLKVEHEGEASGSGVVESIIVTLDLEALKQLGAARSIAYKVCHDELTASRDFVCAVREFSCKVLEHAAAKHGGVAPETSACDAPREP